MKLVLVFSFVILFGWIRPSLLQLRLDRISFSSIIEYFNSRETMCINFTTNEAPCLELTEKSVTRPLIW
ncbi:hypothetical protein CASFOL_037978 [Castilleja foliolosa]|uniref:Uncharacterized protein n=1 Tax=Castilleja foliolosa TaxID=1961234 RepID=A0ABD3BLM9_9LAMI